MQSIQKVVAAAGQFLARRTDVGHEAAMSKEKTEGNSKRSESNDLPSVTARLLEMKRGGAKYQSQEKLANVLGCSKGQINKAFDACEELNEWMTNWKSVAAKQANLGELETVAANISETLIPTDELEASLAQHKKRMSDDQWESLQSELQDMDELEKRRLVTTMVEMFDDDQREHKQQTKRKKRMKP